MITRRLAVLLAVMVCGFSSVLFLPKHLAYQPVGVSLDLPDSIQEWWGTPSPIGEKERVALGADTEFARMNYSNGRGDQIHVSIVLSGQDMNQSIHRPERCLPAQGWTIANSSTRWVRMDPGALAVTRLYNLRNFNVPGQGPVRRYNLAYYWFTGHTDSTSSHLQRTLIDMRDRLLKGYNQRWAYIMVSASITDDVKFGRDERATDELLQTFLRKMVPRIHKAPANDG